MWCHESKWTHNMRYEGGRERATTIPSLFTNVPLDWFLLSPTALAGPSLSPKKGIGNVVYYYSSFNIVNFCRKVQASMANSIAWSGTTIKAISYEYSPGKVGIRIPNTGSFEFIWVLLFGSQIIFTSLSHMAIQNWLALTVLFTHNFFIYM